MADIKLKNYIGEYKEHSDVPKIWLESTESTEQNPILIPFSYGMPVKAEIDLKFSSDDMNVPIPEGELISELTIKKPPALLSGNIKEGVEIAGVIGSLVAGGGGAAGPVQIRTGTFTPPSAPEVLRESIGSYYGFKINSKGFWEKTITSGEFVPVAGRRYQIYYMSELSETAESQESFGSYGKCITIGNKSIISGDGSGFGEILLIYQKNQNKLTILATVSGTMYIDTGEYWQVPDLYIWDIEDNVGGIKIEHGGTTKPDAVFVIQEERWMLPNPRGSVVAAWGIKSSLAHLMPDNKVSGTCGVLGNSSKTAALENADNGSYLSCPDDGTFAFAKNLDGLVFTPGRPCWWFAIWGLESTPQ